MGNKKNGKNLSIQGRLSLHFHKEIEEIKDERLVNRRSKDRVATEKITNMICRHKNWKQIKQDIIKAEQEEVDNYGK